MNVPLITAVLAAPVVGLMLTTLNGPTLDRWFGPMNDRQDARQILIAFFVVFLLIFAAAAS